MRSRVLLLLFGFSWCISLAQTGSLEIQVEGMVTGQGQIGYRLFKGARGFPGDSLRTFRRGFLPVQKPMIFRIDSLPYGEYALALLHDENSNFQLDLNFTKTPKEGIGYSNNGNVSLGPPNYQQAKFYLQSAIKKMTIKIKK